MRAGLRLFLLLLLVIPAFFLWLLWAGRPATDTADRPLTSLPEGPLTITAFGTSLTARNDWPEALNDALSGCLAHPVEVTRVAKPGAGSAWGLEAVEEVIAQAPHLILMEFAINDADMRGGVSLKTAQTQHEAILARLAAALPEAQVLLMTMSPAHGARGWARPFLARHYEQYRELAKAHGAGLLDLYPRWLAARQDLRRFADGLHPGDEAARSVLLAPLVAAISEATGAGC